MLIESCFRRQKKCTKRLIKCCTFDANPNCINTSFKVEGANRIPDIVPDGNITGQHPRLPLGRVFSHSSPGNASTICFKSVVRILLMLNQLPTTVGIRLA